VLYWMLAGLPPFTAEASGLLLAKHITERPPPLRDVEPAVSPAVARVVDQCLEKDPANRPKSAGQVAGDSARSQRPSPQVQSALQLAESSPGPQAPSPQLPQSSGQVSISEGAQRPSPQVQSLGQVSGNSPGSQVPSPQPPQVASWRTYAQRVSALHPRSQWDTPGVQPLLQQGSRSAEEKP